MKLSFQPDNIIYIRFSNQQGVRQSTISVDQRFSSTDNTNKYKIVTTQHLHTTSFVKECCIIFGGNLQLHVLIELSILLLFSDVFITVFDEMKLKLDKPIEFKYSYDNTTSITIIMNFNRISGTALTAIFCLAVISVICLIVQVINVSTSIITVLIEFYANIVSMDQLILNLAAYLSIDAVSCHTQMIRNVCVSFFVFFCFCCFFCFLVCKCCIIDKICRTK